MDPLTSCEKKVLFRPIVWSGGDQAKLSVSTTLNWKNLMAHENVPVLQADQLATRADLETYLLGFASVIFASVGFSQDGDELLISVGTDNARLAQVEAGIWVPALVKSGFQFEAQILKGRAKKDTRA
jgi:hypothetical protein